MMPKVVITPEGGTGSTAFVSLLQHRIKKNPNKKRMVCLRPDTIWGHHCPLLKYPEVNKGRTKQEWAYRSHRFHLFADKTINDNLMNLVKDPERIVLLCGRCSSEGGRFLTENNVKSLALIRHPLHSYVSYLSHRHPAHAAPFGGFKSEKCIRWYAKRWNNVVSDIVDSPSAIVRFEFLASDLRFIDDLLHLDAVNRWKPHIRNWGELPKEGEELLRKLTKEMFDQVYPGEWEI